MCEKKLATFYMSVNLHTLWKPQFGSQYGPRGPPRAIYVPRGSGECRDTYCIERVNDRHLYVKRKSQSHSITVVPYLIYRWKVYCCRGVKMFIKIKWWGVLNRNRFQYIFEPSFNCSRQMELWLSLRLKESFRNNYWLSKIMSIKYKRQIV